MKSVSKSAILTILTQIPAQLFGVIAGIFITRILGPEGRGVYALFFADISLLSTILGFSVGTAITFYVANKKIAREKTIGISLLFSFVTIVLSFLMLAIWLNLPISSLFIPSKNLTGSFILIFCCFVVINHIDILYAAFFQGEKRFAIVNRVLIVNSFLNFGLYGGLFIIYYFDVYAIGINEVLFTALVVMFLNFMHWNYHFRKHYTYTISFKLNWKNDIQPFIRFMGLDHLANIVTFFNNRLVLWIIAFYMSSESVGLFALAFGITQLLSMLSNPLSQVLFPVIWADDAKKHLKTYILFCRAHFSILLVISFVGIVVTPFVLPIVYGVDFYSSILPLQIMFIPAIFSCQTKIFTGILFAENKVKIYLFSALAGLVVTLALNFTLIPTFGIEGAAIASSLSFITTFIVVYLAMAINLKLPSNNLFFLTKSDWGKIKNTLKYKGISKN
jgi:O-antigen/teichoic acid export membrane protein